LKTLYPDRFDDEGNLVNFCTNSSGTVVWGEEACTSIIEDWVATAGTTCVGKEACDAAVQCYAGNDPSGTS